MYLIYCHLDRKIASKTLVLANVHIVMYRLIFLCTKTY